MSGDRREWLGRLIPSQQVAIVRVTLAPHRGDIATQDVQLATVQGVNGWHATVGGIRFRLTARGGEPGTSTTRERLEPAEHAEFLRLDSRFRAALSALKGQAEHSRLWSALERVPLGMDVGVVTPEIVERLEPAVAHLETIRALQVQLRGDMETIGAELYRLFSEYPVPVVQFTVPAPVPPVDPPVVKGRGFPRLVRAGRPAAVWVSCYGFHHTT